MVSDLLEDKNIGLFVFGNLWKSYYFIVKRLLLKLYPVYNVTNFMYIRYDIMISDLSLCYYVLLSYTH